VIEAYDVTNESTDKYLKYRQRLENYAKRKGAEAAEFYATGWTVYIKVAGKVVETDLPVDELEYLHTFQAEWGICSEVRLEKVDGARNIIFYFKELTRGDKTRMKRYGSRVHI